MHALALGPLWDVAPHPEAGADGAAGHRSGVTTSRPFPGGMKPPVVDGRARASSTTGSLTPSALREARALRVAQRSWRALACSLRAGPPVPRRQRPHRAAAAQPAAHIRLGYPPAIVRKADRNRYLDALRHADEGDCGPLGELLARAILDSLHRFLLPALAKPEQLVPLPALATNRLSTDALRVAAVRGRLQAVKGRDGGWRSSRAWVDDYVATRYRRAA